jgi:hypothetical protein
MPVRRVHRIRESAEGPLAIRIRFLARHCRAIHTSSSVLGMRRDRRLSGILFRGILSGLLVLCGAVLPAVPAGAVPARWHVTPSPSKAGANELDAVACGGPRFCAAVGESRLGGGGTLIEMWHGRRWSLAPSPSPGLLPDRGSLVAVSCPTASFCAAVGYYDTALLRELPLIEIWNGHRWSISPGPRPGSYSHLLGVSCTSSRDCEAVGLHERNCSAHSGGSAGLAERWNGRSWSIVPSPPKPCGSTQLQAVSCSAASHCTATGSYLHGPGDWTLVESWNGTHWSIVPSPNGKPDNNNDLQGVSCTSSKRCVAVGWYQATFAGPALTLAESWNGTKWSIMTSPSAAAQDPLNSVSCTGPANCVAAGDRWYSTANAKTLGESWDGSAWSVASSPNPRPVQELSGIACTRGSACEAVGYDGTSTDLPARTLVETGG